MLTINPSRYSYLPNPIVALPLIVWISIGQIERPVPPQVPPQAPPPPVQPPVVSVQPPSLPMEMYEDPSLKPQAGHRRYEVQPIPYRAVIHPGELLHSTKRVTVGERIHLIGTIPFLSFSPPPPKDHNTPSRQRRFSPFFITLVWLKTSSKFERFMELDPELQKYIFGFLCPSQLATVSLVSTSFLNRH